jgi:hypothetical protein
VFGHGWFIGMVDTDELVVLLDPVLSRTYISSSVLEHRPTFAENAVCACFPWVRSSLAVGPLSSSCVSITPRWCGWRWCRQRAKELPKLYPLRVVVVGLS